MLTYNQKNVCDNKFQGETKKVLAICSMGALRSPTAANVLHREYSYNTRSCGLDTSWAIVPISEALLYWADEIVVMESWMAHEVEKLMFDSHSIDPNGKGIICLGIPDNYSYMQEELQELIIEKYESMN